jgi:hypothetical protein
MRVIKVELHNHDTDSGYAKICKTDAEANTLVNWIQIPEPPSGGYCPKMDAYGNCVCHITLTVTDIEL